MILASYPKSGSTWVRLFISACLDGKLDINNLNPLVRQSDLQSHLYTAETGKALVELTEEEVYEARANVIRRCRGFVKTHSQWASDLDFDALKVVRDPRGIAPSYAGHFGLSLDDAISCMADPEATLEDRRPLNHKIGRWDDHVNSWDCPHVRFEDLPDKFSWMKDYLELPGDLDVALNLTRLSNCRAQEEENGFLEISRNQRRFFSGENETLSESQKRRIERAFGETMERYGYL